MSQKSVTFPCTDVKFSKPFPKLTGKLSGFFYKKMKKNQFYLQIFHIFSMLLQSFFSKITIFSNFWPRLCWKSNYFPFSNFQPQNSSLNTLKLKTFSCTGEGNKDKHLPLKVPKQQFWNILYTMRANLSGNNFWCRRSALNPRRTDFR